MVLSRHWSTNLKISGSLSSLGFPSSSFVMWCLPLKKIAKADLSKFDSSFLETLTILPRTFTYMFWLSLISISLDFYLVRMPGFSSVAFLTWLVLSTILCGWVLFTSGVIFNVLYLYLAPFFLTFFWTIFLVFLIFLK